MNDQKITNDIHNDDPHPFKHISVFTGKTTIFDEIFFTNI